MHIYTIFVHEILARDQPPDDPDLARFSSPIKITEALARIVLELFGLPKSIYFGLSTSIEFHGFLKTLRKTSVS